MPDAERRLYPSYLRYVLNRALLPAKLVVPQPFIARIPGLTTNLEIRTGLVLHEVTGRLLDIGCGENHLVRKYRLAGGEGAGVDVHPWPGVDLLVENSARLPYADKAFDTITLVACINHIPNRVDVLGEARRLLAPTGRLVLTNLTPGLSRLWHFWAFWDEDQNERGLKPGEVYGFTHASLMELLACAGFRLIKRQKFSWGLNSLYVFEPAE
jgi:SAM-dependent methyltransferase